MTLDSTIPPSNSVNWCNRVRFMLGVPLMIFQSLSNYRAQVKYLNSLVPYFSTILIKKSIIKKIIFLSCLIIFVYKGGQYNV